MVRIETVAENLNKHGFQAQVFQKAEQAKEAALALIGKGSVGFGGSKTVESMGLYDALKEAGNEVYWHWKVDKEQIPATFQKANAADVYMCSSNAILESGALLNIDGTGNRIANLFFGPKTVIVIAGQNKIAGNYEDALARIKLEACPPNAKRLGLKTPCSVGKCTDCTSPQRMCRITALLERPTYAAQNVHVLLVKENLGY